LTEIYLCHACSDHQIEDGNARAGVIDVFNAQLVETCLRRYTSAMEAAGPLPLPQAGEPSPFQRVGWVAVPKASRARRVNRADRGAWAGQGGRTGALRGAAVRDREEPAAGGGTGQGGGPPGSACSTACHARGWPVPVRRRRRRRRRQLGPLPTAPTVDACAATRLTIGGPKLTIGGAGGGQPLRVAAGVRRGLRRLRAPRAGSRGRAQAATHIMSSSSAAPRPPRPPASLTHHSIDVPTAEPGIRACVWKPEVLVVVVCVLPVPHALRRSTCSRASSEPAVSILGLSVHID
jgi:hypothetical protein